MKEFTCEFGENKLCAVCWTDDYVIIEFHRPPYEGEELPEKPDKGRSASSFMQNGNVVSGMKLSHEAAEVLCGGLLKMIEERHQPTEQQP